MRLHVVVVLFLYTCWAVFQVAGGIVSSLRATDDAIVGKDRTKLWYDAFAHSRQAELIPVCCVHAAAVSAALPLSPDSSHHCPLLLVSFCGLGGPPATGPCSSASSLCPARLPSSSATSSQASAPCS